MNKLLLVLSMFLSINANAHYFTESEQSKIPICKVSQCSKSAANGSLLYYCENSRETNPPPKSVFGRIEVLNILPTGVDACICPCTPEYMGH